MLIRTSYKFDSHHLVLVVACDNLAERPLSNMARKLQLPAVNFPVIASVQNLIRVVYLACNINETRNNVRGQEM